ncbi:hypothetical protein ACPC54_34195 [Kitasatospora sp. NPDC094028]
MAKIRLSNTTEKPLGIWVEPWGEDYWMKPGEKFTVVADTPEDADPEEASFEVVLHDQGASVWVTTGPQPYVYGNAGNELDCGHQRPLDVLRTWTENMEAAAERPHLSPKLRDSVRAEAEIMRRELSRAEAAAREAQDG